MRFKINQKVKVKNEDKFITIIDFESFDNLNLYYTSDKKAYPEENLIESPLIETLTFLFLTSEEEKNRIFKETMEKINYKS